eukprot:jgi/Mesen1/1553/ME000134S00674
MVQAQAAGGISRGNGDDMQEFIWGAMAGAFGETTMHPVDTLKTRIQSAKAGDQSSKYKSLGSMFRHVVKADGARGLYRGVGPGLTGSLITGATYFGTIELTKDRLTEHRPDLIGPWSHFAAGAIGDAVGSVVYVPCEVIKQRMQLQGSLPEWERRMVSGSHPPSKYSYYKSMLQAGGLIVRQEGFLGLYSGFLSTLARDVPFAGLQIMFYELIKQGVHWSHVRWGIGGVSGGWKHEFSSPEELAMGGTAGGIAAALTTPLDVIKTRLQIQGAGGDYGGWSDALRKILREEGYRGLLKGWVPRVLWFVPASALTFLALDLLHKAFDSEAHPEATTSPAQKRPPARTGDESRDASAAAVKQLQVPNVEPCI